MSAFERIRDAMTALAERDELSIGEELAPVLHDTPGESNNQVSRLAQATLTQATLMQLLESNGGDVEIAVPDAISYALSTGILIGYQLGSADALERDPAT